MGNIAHELRTPMTTIKALSTACWTAPSRPKTRTTTWVLSLRRWAALTRLIKNMLDITKLEAGEYK